MEGSNMVSGPNFCAVVMPLVRLLAENGSELSWSNREMIAAAISDAMRVHKSMLDEQRHIAGGAFGAAVAESGQSEPTEGDASHVFHGVMLPSHERIRAKYQDNVNPPTALERLVFDTTVDAPGQGEALRALLEGGPAVPVVTP